MEINMPTNKHYSIQINGVSFDFLVFNIEHHKRKGEFIDKTLHAHSHAELFYCSEKSIQIDISDEKIILEKNDIAIVPPGLKHVRTPDFSENTQWGAIGLLCTRNKTITNYHDDFYSIFNAILYGDKIFIFRNSPLCSSIKKIYPEEKVDTITLLEFVCNFYKSAKDKNIEEIAIPKKSNVKNIDRLIILDHILNTEYMNSFTNQEIADKLFLSKRQLSRLVMAHYGAPLHELITKKRLEAVAAQLIDTNHSIEELCHAFGFSNKTIFYQQFKNKFKTTPAQYRKENARESLPVKKKT